MTTTTIAPMTGAEIVDLCKKHTLYEWSAQSKIAPIPVARAQGIYFWTPEGKRFIDFNSQLMSVNIGHGDERVIAAISEQLGQFAYANPFLAHGPRARLGAKLAAITPGDIDTFFFTNGGVEATENAIKIARFFTGRHKIMARYRSYHALRPAVFPSPAILGDGRLSRVFPAWFMCSIPITASSADGSPRNLRCRCWKKLFSSKVPTPLLHSFWNL
jgi:aminotransferase class III